MVFVIKYDFVLIEDITLGSGCVLCFDGGSISGNQTLTGNGTTIIGFKNCISGVTLAGTYKNNTVNVSWFTENTDKALVNAVALGKTIILDKDITFTQDITLTKSDVTIKSNHRTITEGLYSLQLNGVSNVTFEGVNFYGTETVEENHNDALAFVNASNSAIKDCVLDGCYSYGFIFQSSTKCSVEGCEFKQTGALVRNVLCYGKSCDQLTISNNRLKNIGLVYPVRIDLCTNTYILKNSFVNVDNNPILVNTGCAYCVVSENYIDTNQDSGILVANDPVYIPDGQGGETTTRETAHHIIISKNHVRNSKDAAIGLYNVSAGTNGYVHHIQITDNICEDNGLTSTSAGFRTQIYLATCKNVIVTGNILRTTELQTDVHGFYVQDNINPAVAYTFGRYEDSRIIIKNNTVENIKPVKLAHLSLGGQVAGLVTDIGVPTIQDFNLYKADGGTGFPESVASFFTWASPSGGYAVVPTIDADKREIELKSSNTVYSTSLVLIFADLSLFYAPCVFTIRGLAKYTSEVSDEVLQIHTTTNETRPGVRFYGTDFAPFELSVVCDKENGLSVWFPAPKSSNSIIFKDVEFEIRYL